jgi:ribosomal protein L11 methyltransferase
MGYLEYNVTIEPFQPETSEALIALLGDYGFESFVENETGFQAYIKEEEHKVSFFEKALSKLITRSEVKYTFKKIKDENWNALWESNFEPVIIDTRIAVVAPFHQINPDTKYVIKIEPKMSFGTGHHETTSQVMLMMLEVEMKGATVLDMGCGTGILAILAHKLGAIDIVGIDNDPQAVENAIENFERNSCPEIVAITGDTGAIPSKMFDIILANINRNTIADNVGEWIKYLKIGGHIIFSGFYEEDIVILKVIFDKLNLTILKTTTNNKWACLLCEKH